jgi:transposase-like protein
MDISCKKCGASEVIKSGTQDGKQRYLCRKCNAVFRNTKPKYSSELKAEVIKLYLGSGGIRAIGKAKGIHHSVISYWIKKAGIIMKEAFIEKMEKVQEKNIQILEVDELFTYVKKRPIKSIYLLLSTECETELLISK